MSKANGWSCTPKESSYLSGLHRNKHEGAVYRSNDKVGHLYLAPDMTNEIRLLLSHYFAVAGDGVEVFGTTDYMRLCPPDTAPLCILEGDPHRILGMCSKTIDGKESQIITFAKQ